MGTPGPLGAQFYLAGYCIEHMVLIKAFLELLKGESILELFLGPDLL